MVVKAKRIIYIVITVFIRLIFEAYLLINETILREFLVLNRLI